LLAVCRCRVSNHQPQPLLLLLQLHLLHQPLPILLLLLLFFFCHVLGQVLMDVDVLAVKANQVASESESGNGSGSEPVVSVDGSESGSGSEPEVSEPEEVVVSGSGSENRSCRSWTLTWRGIEIVGECAWVWGCGSSISRFVWMVLGVEVCMAAWRVGFGMVVVVVFGRRQRIQ
jgi:hypothetical protein